MAAAKKQYSIPIVERRAAIFLLISLAMIDGKAGEREIEFLAKAAARFGCQLKRAHIRPFDITKCIETIQSPSLKRMLLLEFIELGQIDGLWDDQEKAIVVRAAKHWQLELPKIPGVNWEQVPDFVDDGQRGNSQSILENKDLLKKIINSDPVVEFSYFRVVKHGDTLLVVSSLGQKRRELAGCSVLLLPVLLSISCGFAQSLSTDIWLTCFAILVAVLVVAVPGILLFGDNLFELTNADDMEISKGPGGSLRIRRGKFGFESIEVIENIESMLPATTIVENTGGPYTVRNLIKYEMRATLKDGSTVPIIQSESDSVAVDFLAQTILLHMNGEDGWGFLNKKLRGYNSGPLFGAFLLMAGVAFLIAWVLHLIWGEPLF